MLSFACFDIPGLAGMGIGMMDVAVIGGVAALAVYWFALRKKKDDIPEVKKLTIA